VACGVAKVPQDGPDYGPETGSLVEAKDDSATSPASITRLSLGRIYRTTFTSTRHWRAFKFPWTRGQRIDVLLDGLSGLDTVVYLYKVSASTGRPYGRPIASNDDSEESDWRLSTNRRPNPYSSSILAFELREDRYYAVLATTYDQTGVGSAELLVRAAEAARAEWDAFADFSTTSNPAGAWTYGSIAPGSRTLVPFTRPERTAPGVFVWWNGTDPAVTKNLTREDIIHEGGILLPAADFLHVHPGPSGELDVVRWTAPSSGTARIDATFRGLRTDDCGQTVDVHVFHNGAQIFRADITSRADVRPVARSVDVEAGDDIDFAVGPGPDGYVCDSTGLRAAITLGR
jgi:hypothetical protein